MAKNWNFRKRKKGESQKAYRKAYRKAWLKTPKGKAYIKATSKKWNNSEKGKAYIKAYHKTPKGKAHHKAWRKTPKGKACIKACIKAWKKTVKGHLRETLANRTNQAIKKAGVEKSASTTVLLGCDIGAAVKHIEGLWDPKMSWANYGQGPGHWNIDHVIAIGLFDLTNSHEQRMAFHFLNLQPLWHEQHVVKNIEDRALIKEKRAA